MQTSGSLSVAGLTANGTIQLAPGILDTGRYGNRYDGASDADGIIEATFQRPSGTAELALKGFDIDYATEVELRLNQISLGFLSKGPNEALNAGDRFELPASALIDGANALSFVQTGKPSYVWGITDLLLTTGAPVGGTADIVLTTGVTDTRAFGNRYAGTSDSDGILTASFQATGAAMRLSLKGYDIDYASEVEVLLDGNPLGHLAVGPNEALNAGDSFRIDAPAPGEHILTFRQTGKPSYVWGIQDLRIELVDDAPPDPPPPPPTPAADIELTIGVLDSTRYGNKFGTATDADGIISAAFERGETDLILLLEGYDVDYATEIAVSLNGETLGYLNTGPNNDLNGGDRFEIAHERLLAGTNILTFEETGKPSYVWGFTDLLLEPARVVVEPPPPPTSGPEIDIYLYDGRPILDGDHTPDPADGTDYGGIDIESTLLDAHYRLANRGDEPLTITGLRIAGDDHAVFSLQPLNQNPIAPGEIAQLTVRFDPDAVGSYTARVEIVSNDADEDIFDFAIRGGGIDYGPTLLSDLLPAEELIGSPTNDQIYGTSLAELLDAKGGDDIQHGGNGDDFLVIGPGSDKNYGGSGIDVALFDGEIGDFSGVSGIADAYTIDDLEPADGDLGFDRVKAVEFLVFHDAIFDTSSGISESFVSEAALVDRLAGLLNSQDIIA